MFYNTDVGEVTNWRGYKEPGVVGPMRAFGKFLQILGLALLPLSMILDLTGGSDPLRPFGVSQMVLMLGFGVAVFFIGRIIEGYSV